MVSLGTWCYLALPGVASGGGLTSLPLDFDSVVSCEEHSLRTEPWMMRRLHIMSHDAEAQRYHKAVSAYAGLAERMC